jgi:aminoglycoside phosphotransferase (APT) family kinase protein
MELIDKPGDIRNGEGLETEKIKEFLESNLGQTFEDVTIRQFRSGYSNLTYLVEAQGREYVLRRPPFGAKAATAHDMKREFDIMNALKPVYPYCPNTVIYCDDESVIGAPFYLMERIKGIILRRDPPEGLHYAPEKARELCERLLDAHVELHSIDYTAVGLNDFGKPQGYVARQVEGWSKRFRNAWTQDAPDFESIMLWIGDNQPVDTETPSVIHNDYRLDNVVLDPHDPVKIIGVLDWEMATIGNPLMDLGNSMAYWIQKDDPPEMQALRLMPTNMEGALTRDELVARYAYMRGETVDSFDFYYCFGLFRLAVIAQQIYYRYYHGQTTDERFKMLIFGVHALETACKRVIEGS